MEKQDWFEKQEWIVESVDEWVPLEESGDFWIAETIGDTLIGVLEKKAWHGSEKDHFPCAYIRSADGELYLVRFDMAMLKKPIDRYPVGKPIKIVYKGTRPSKRGNDMKVFTIYGPKGIELGKPWSEENPYSEDLPF